VITAVARDDVPDGGADHFRETILKVYERCPSTVVEVLVPDFQDHDPDIQAVLSAKPHIYNHNLETVRRLTPTVRHRATYDRSLSVLRKAKEMGKVNSVFTKSGLMLGLGEQEEELLQALRDLRAVGCDILTLGQYLQPTPQQLPVVEFITPERFARYKQIALDMGFVHVASGPMVRSSYHAEEFNTKKTE
jgi:lipoic acid synthetase